MDADARIRLRAQAPHEELSWSEVENLFTMPEGLIDMGIENPSDTTQADAAQLKTTSEDVVSEDEEGPVLPSAEDVPRALRSIIQCACYLQKHRPEHDMAALALFKKDVHVPTPYEASIESAEQDGSKAPIDYLAISSGDALGYWASTFLPTVALYSVPPPLVDGARDWLKSLAKAKEQHQKQHSDKQAVNRREGRGDNQHRRAPVTAETDEGAERHGERGHGRGHGRGSGRARGRGRGRGRGVRDVVGQHLHRDEGPSPGGPAESLFVP